MLRQTDPISCAELHINFIKKWSQNREAHETAETLSRKHKSNVHERMEAPDSPFARNDNPVAVADRLYVFFNIAGSVVATT
jgi:hypothetical protein